jgi:hypothetical protein
MSRKGRGCDAYGRLILVHRPEMRLARTRNPTKQRQRRTVDEGDNPRPSTASAVVTCGEARVDDQKGEKE